MTPEPGYSDPLYVLYADDVDALARFYCETFGFVETFRTPVTGRAKHVEARLGALVLGFGARAAALADHGVDVPRGAGGGALVLFTPDVDATLLRLTAAGVRTLRAPHTFQPDALKHALRTAWVLDPEDNHIHLVARVSKP